MAIPKFYYFMRPALEYHSGKGEVALSNVFSAMAAHFNISPEEQQILLPNGSTTRFKDRVHWALTYLRKACLLEKVGTGVNRITLQGENYLPDAPTIIKINDLNQFPVFAAWRQGSNQLTSHITTDLQTAQPPSLVDETIPLPEQTEATPQENMEAAYGVLKESLAQEVLEYVKSMTPARFEKLVVQLMLRLGYGGGVETAGETLGKSGDGGVDGVIYEDKLGLDKIYLQAKRWNDNTVTNQDVLGFIGALSSKGASKGVFITTSAFTEPAKQVARNNQAYKVSLVDGTELSRLMIEYDLGVSLVKRYDVKRVDSDFFADE